MLYGLYLSAQGAEAQARRLDVVSHNLANSSTSGFKRELAVFQAHRTFDAQQGNDDSPTHLKQATGGISLAEVATDFSIGPAIETGGTFDVALVGAGFLHLTDGRQEYLTRNGRLAVDEQGQLATPDGMTVLGTSGAPISIPKDAGQIEITADGGVWSTEADGTRSNLGQLKLVHPESTDALEKLGHNLYLTRGRLRPAGIDVQVRQGFVEGSGVNPVTEMLQMIEASRSFENNINMIRAQDESLGQLLQSMMR